MFDEEGENAGPFDFEVACEKFSVHLDVEITLQKSGLQLLWSPNI